MIFSSAFDPNSFHFAHLPNKGDILTHRNDDRRPRTVTRRFAQDGNVFFEFADSSTAAAELLEWWPQAGDLVQVNAQAYAEWRAAQEAKMRLECIDVALCGTPKKVVGVEGDMALVGPPKSGVAGNGVLPEFQSCPQKEGCIDWCVMCANEHAGPGGEFVRGGAGTKDGGSLHLWRSALRRVPMMFCHVLDEQGVRLAVLRSTGKGKSAGQLSLLEAAS